MRDVWLAGGSLCLWSFNGGRIELPIEEKSPKMVTVSNKKLFHDLDLNKYFKSCWSLAASSFGPCELVNSIIQCGDYCEQSTQYSVEPRRKALFLA